MFRKEIWNEVDGEFIDLFAETETFNKMRKKVRQLKRTKQGRLSTDRSMVPFNRVVYRESDHFPGLCGSMKIAETDEYGRHFLVTDVIEPCKK